MAMVRRAAIAAAFLVSTLSACSGAPPPPPPPLGDAQFQQIFNAARVPDDAFQEDRNLTVILARTDLSLEQRLKTLNFRAISRSTIGENKNGAIADYEELLALAPSDHPMVARVREDLDYVRQQKRYIEDRLEGRARSDNIQHFEDLLALGRHDEAVAFMKYTGLKPHAVYIEKLANLGYLCEGSNHSGASFQWGASNTGMHTVYWCDSPPPVVARGP